MSHALSAADSDSTASPTRPSSSWTANSLFADSAISVQTPAPLQKDTDPFASVEPDLSEEPSISERLNGLVSEIWAYEQDEALPRDKRRKLVEAVEGIEAILLQADSLSEAGSDAEVAGTTTSATRARTSTADVKEEDLDLVRSSLAATVDSMRMRKQEQQHLHQLAVEKLEAVAQRCIQQEQRLRQFAQEIEGLKEDNQTLHQENQVLHVQLNAAQSECAKKDTAVKAMSSAVSGLEGYVNGTPSPVRSAITQRIVTRGKGRFRGRYYADEPAESPVGYGLDGASDGQILHEGVTAWLRGFRDIEEELRSAQAGRAATRKTEVQAVSKVIEGEWVDFESATST